MAIHRPRHGRRGGGVALIHRSTLRVNPLSINVKVASFEHLSVSIKINSVCINMVTVYGPPSTKPALFLEEFAGCLELLVAIIRVCWLPGTIGSYSWSSVSGW